MQCTWADNEYGQLYNVAHLMFIGGDRLWFVCNFVSHTFTYMTFTPSPSPGLRPSEEYAESADESEELASVRTTRQERVYDQVSPNTSILASMSSSIGDTAVNASLMTSQKFKEKLALPQWITTPAFCTVTSVKVTASGQWSRVLCEQIQVTQTFIEKVGCLSYQPSRRLIPSISPSIMTLLGGLSNWDSILILSLRWLDILDGTRTTTYNSFYAWCQGSSEKALLTGAAYAFAA